MRQTKEHHRGIWTEDSAVWEIIAGEVMVQSQNPAARRVGTLLRRSGDGAAEAARLAASEDLDHAGHAMIGCAVALALAAIADSPEPKSVEGATADLAASLSWQAAEPDVQQLAGLAETIDRLADLEADSRHPTMWEVAVRAGAYAAGMSQHITRRRDRRDVLTEA